MNPTITAFERSPDRGRGLARDMRIRWALEEVGQSCDVRLVSFAAMKQPVHLALHPFGQIPTYEEGDLVLFESGAILLHLAEKDARLMPRDPQARANTLAWLFAAYNSVEPMLFELGNVDIFAKDEEWARLRRPSLIEFIQGRLGRLNDAIGDKPYLVGEFTVADIAMATVLRDIEGSGLLEERPVLMAYLERAISRPAFKAALAAQLADFRPSPAAAA